MPSFFKSAAVLALAAIASAQTALNTTAPVAASIAGWRYEGCFSVQANVGLLLASSPFMTPQLCTAYCGNYALARTQGNNCFCADSVNGTTPVPEAQCSTRCGGNPALACGRVPGASFKRQAAGGAASVYSRLAVVPVGVNYISIITNVYIDICPTCAGGVGPVTYCSAATLTGCGCPNPTTPTIPMSTLTTTVAVACPTCPAASSGSSVSTVTLTVPAGVTPGTVAPGQSTVTAPVVAVVSCSTCPNGSATTTVSQCLGCATTSGGAVVPAGPTTVVGGGAGGAGSAGGASGASGASATPTRAVVIAGAAQNVKLGGGLLAAGVVAVAALL